MQRVEELEKEIKELRKEVLARDRIINDLRLRLPPSTARDSAIAKATANGLQGQDADDVDYEGRQAVRVAQSTVHHLQVSAKLSITNQRYIFWNASWFFKSSKSRNSSFSMQFRLKNETCFKNYKS